MTEDRVPMTFAERNTWVYIVVTMATTIAYFAVVLSRLADQPASEVSWVAPMLWAIGANIVGVIVATILASIGAGIANRGVLESSADVRDKQIDRYGERVTQGIMAFGAGSVLILAMIEADWFWIGNALFLLGAIGTLCGAIVKIRAYRRGFHG